MHLGLALVRVRLWFGRVGDGGRFALRCSPGRAGEPCLAPAPAPPGRDPMAPRRMPPLARAALLLLVAPLVLTASSASAAALQLPAAFPPQRSGWDARRAMVQGRFRQVAPGGEGVWRRPDRRQLRQHEELEEGGGGGEAEAEAEAEVAPPGVSREDEADGAAGSEGDADVPISDEDDKEDEEEMESGTGLPRQVDGLAYVNPEEQAPPPPPEQDDSGTDTSPAEDNDGDAEEPGSSDGNSYRDEEEGRVGPVDNLTADVEEEEVNPEDEAADEQAGEKDREEEPGTSVDEAEAEQLDSNAPVLPDPEAETQQEEVVEDLEVDEDSMQGKALAAQALDTRDAGTSEDKPAFRAPPAPEFDIEDEVLERSDESDDGADGSGDEPSEASGAEVAPSPDEIRDDEASSVKDDTKGGGGEALPSNVPMEVTAGRSYSDVHGSEQFGEEVYWPSAPGSRASWGARRPLRRAAPKRRPTSRQPAAKPKPKPKMSEEQKRQMELAKHEGNLFRLHGKGASERRAHSLFNKRSSAHFAAQSKEIFKAHDRPLANFARTNEFLRRAKARSKQLKPARHHSAFAEVPGQSYQPGPRVRPHERRAVHAAGKARDFIARSARVARRTRSRP